MLHECYMNASLRPAAIWMYYPPASFFFLFTDYLNWSIHRDIGNLRTHAHARTHTHTHAHIHTRTHTRTHARTHLPTHTRKHTHTHTHTHKHAHTRTHTRTHPHTHTAISATAASISTQSTADSWVCRFVGVQVRPCQGLPARSPTPSSLPCSK